MAETKRIYDLSDENDVQNAFVMSDVTGRPEALKTPLNLFALRSELLPIEITDNAYFDLNYIGWSQLNGMYYFSALGSAISNAFFTPQAGSTYFFICKVSNVTSKIHLIEVFVTSDTDFINTNRHAARSGASFVSALSIGWTEYIYSPLAYVAGIQAIQATDATDRANSTGDWLTTGVIVSLTELDPSSSLRFDASFLTSGVNPNAEVQFRILENGSEIAIGGIIAIGNETISNSFSFVVDSHSAVPPTDFEVEFKNFGGTITLYGTQKAGSMIVTEIYQTTR